MASVLGTMMVTIENIPGPNAGNASHMRKDEAGISASYKAACALPDRDQCHRRDEWRARIKCGE